MEMQAVGIYYHNTYALLEHSQKSVKAQICTGAWGLERKRERLSSKYLSTTWIE